jgi:hypothetical protein
MSIECYNDVCPFHGIHFDDEGPFCDEPKCHVVPKYDLVDGATYRGECRNASVAVWHKDKNVFTYKRYKFGDVFDEDICYMTDDKVYDVFIPYELIEENYEKI